MLSIETALRDHGIGVAGSSLRRPMLPSTHAAQVVRLYTNARGKYVATVQHARSHLRAHVFSRRREGVGAGE